MSINKISVNGQNLLSSSGKNVGNKANMSFKALNFAYGQEFVTGKINNESSVLRISKKQLSGIVTAGVASFLSLLPKLKTESGSKAFEYASIAAKTAQDAQNTAYALDINRAEMVENERLKGTRVFNKERFELKMANHPVIKELRGLHQNIVEDNNEVSELFAREAAMKFEKDLDKVFSQSKATKLLESFGLKSLEDFVGNVHSNIELGSYSGTINVSERQAKKLTDSNFNVPVAKTSEQTGLGKILIDTYGNEDENSMKLMIFGPASKLDFKMLDNLNKSLAQDCGAALEKLLSKHFPDVETRNFNKFSSRSLNENIVENYLINKLVAAGVKILKDENGSRAAILDYATIAGVK